MFTIKRAAARLDAAIAALPPERRAEVAALVRELIPTLRRYKATFDAVGDGVADALKDLIVPLAIAASRGKGGEMTTRILEHAPTLAAALREVTAIADADARPALPST